MILQLLVLPLVALSLILSGCASPIGDSANAFDHFLTEEVTMMIDNPMAEDPNKAEPKEVVLHKGTRVRLIERGGAMALVETMKGERGRVPSIDLESSDPNQSDEPQAKMGKKFVW